VLGSGCRHNASPEVACQLHQQAAHATACRLDQNRLALRHGGEVTVKSEGAGEHLHAQHAGPVGNAIMSARHADRDADGMRPERMFGCQQRYRID